MWSDPPAIADDWFCAGFCTDAGLERLNAFLDDPANDTRPYDACRLKPTPFRWSSISARALLSSTGLKICSGSCRRINPCLREIR